MGRHHAAGSVSAEPRSRRNRLRLALAVGLVAVLVAGVIAIIGNRAANCGDVAEVSVIADPVLAPAVRAQSALVANKCVSYAVREVPDSEVAGDLAGGEGSDLWLAPSPNRVTTVAKQLGRELSSTTVASSPIVLAGAGIEPPADWLVAFRSPAIRAVGNDSPYRDAPVIAGVSQAFAGGDPQALRAALAQYAQAAQRVTGDPVAAAAATNGVVAVPEYAYLAEKKGNAALTAIVPESGAPREELQLVVTAPNARNAQALAAAENLAQAFTADANGEVLASSGLRGVDLSLSPPDGVGKVNRLPDPDAGLLAEAQRAFASVAVPLKALVVVDTSGSMNFMAGQVSRIGMLVSGVSTVVSQIPDANSVGLWSFSLRQDGPDFSEVVPTRRLDVRDGARSQREILLEGIRELPGRVNGGTGLYDTTLAAYERALRDFDPAFLNSVILLTDGSDESNGISLNRLLERLRTLADPSRPVVISTVGISRDADMSALRQIADATGGVTTRVDSEQEMLNYFVTAIAERGN